MRNEKFNFDFKHLVQHKITCMEKNCKNKKRTGLGPNLSQLNFNPGKKLSSV